MECLKTNRKHTVSDERECHCLCMILLHFFPLLHPFTHWFYFSFRCEILLWIIMVKLFLFIFSSRISAHFTFILTVHDFVKTFHKHKLNGGALSSNLNIFIHKIHKMNKAKWLSSSFVNRQFWMKKWTRGR